LKLTLLLLCLLALAGHLLADGPLTDQRIMELVKSGVTQSEIQRLIASAPSVDFLMTPAAMDELAQAGVSDDTIKVMAARESGAAPVAQSTVTPALGPAITTKVLPERATSPIGKPAGFGSRTDVFGGYSYLSLDVPDTDRLSFNGWEASVTPLADHQIAPEISGSGYYKSSGFGSASAYAFLGGPRIRFGQAFFHALAGVDVIKASAFGFSDSETAFATALGGGAQSKPFGGHFAIRFGADYILTTHDAGVGESPIQNHFRVTSGIVYVFGARNENR
jgi:hypothetical protein